jgi:hypothetical protein
VVTYRRVLKTSCGQLVSAAWSSWTLKSYSSLLPSLAFGPPKCDVSHLVDPRSALCSSASVTRRYLVTCRHDIPLPSHLARSQRVTTSTQVGLRAVCTLQPQHATPLWPHVTKGATSLYTSCHGAQLLYSLHHLGATLYPQSHHSAQHLHACHATAALYMPCRSPTNTEVEEDEEEELQEGWDAA